MTRSEVEQALAAAVDAESKVGLRWMPGTEMAPIAFRRWSSFSRRHKNKHPTAEDRIRDLAKGLQAHYEPDISYTPLSEWLHLARILGNVFADAESSNERAAEPVAAEPDRYLAKAHRMYNVLTFTEAGPHAANEDAFAVEAHPDDSACCVCAVADGQGGRSGGRDAAQIACRVTIETALSHSTKQLARPASWSTILRAADDAVHQSSEAGYTTLVAACITPSIVCGASSGDSAAVVFTGGRDHHRLTQNQIKNPPVGSGFAEFVPFSSRLTVPWVVLLMSDGVWKYAGWDTIISAFTQRDGQAIIDALQNSARLPASGEFQDDFTIVAVQNTD